MCRSGNQHVCEHVTELVPGVSYWGAFAEFVVARHADVNLVGLPDSIGFVDSAGLACRYTTAFHAVIDQGRVRGGEWVVVYGAGGGTGLAAAQIAAAVGAEVIAVDIDEDKLAATREVGAVHTVNAARVEPVDTVRTLTDGGAHVSLDTVGIPTTCRNSVLSLRTRGRHVQTGHTTKADQGVIALPIDIMMVKELEILSAFGCRDSASAP